jgi:hypothetical protein
MPQIGGQGYRIDLTIRQREDRTFIVTLKNPDNSYIDLTGCSISANLRKQFFHGTIYDFGVAITDAVNGQFTFGLTNAQSLAIPCGASENDGRSGYVWNLDLTYADGNVSPLFWGNLYVVAGTNSGGA